jgi:hypothetical protein
MKLASNLRAGNLRAGFLRTGESPIRPVVTCEPIPRASSTSQLSKKNKTGTNHNYFYFSVLYAENSTSKIISPPAKTAGKQHDLSDEQLR